MVATDVLSLGDVEQRVCDVVSEILAIPRQEISPSSRLIEDLATDNLDFIDLFMGLEEEFDVSLPARSAEPAYKAVFTRQPFRLADFAELVYLQQRAGAPRRPWRQRAKVALPAPDAVAFTQLGGIWDRTTSGDGRLFERLKVKGAVPSYRRRSDGMRCLLLPAATVEIGGEGPEAQYDEGPAHSVDLDAFLIDAEPVSTTAYCRFLNSIGEVDPATLTDWFVLDPKDGRSEHAVIVLEDRAWRPILGAERWPMILVSWYGANAYGLWANGRDWQGYRDEGGSRGEGFLPTEAQWEYAARGVKPRRFPWGDDPPTEDRMNFGRHRPGDNYRAETLPMAAVNEQSGVSPFGLHHMAGNVWQWCRDWYDRGFYRQSQASEPNAVNRAPTGVRSERGGSWVGPAELCRSSYRRGRAPEARGRCLGFRCIGAPPGVR